ncbi:radical SAM family heme chaperone HemW [Bifidobacterium xylocopae]|uniref:Heme chaperone HemW n=1 Tax=Bifidobacterium xylocopae TaxID=2493119 RepID=A0A366KC84_9BIFI|nr:radical SAM family heme chaperone HemW [Bifidobacterium xylocopae]RBP99340.1 coproporphyrinogen III oxidase [Bifidobacterium xylocopae]
MAEHNIAAWSGAIARTPFELYIHVPFCLRRCGYCDFNTYTAVDMGEGASRGNYVNLAIQEMKLVRLWQEVHGIVEPALSTIFLGGGTPTVLQADELNRLIRAADEIWGISPGAEITTEANPDTVDAAYLERLAQGGFNRVSFGMQSAVPDVLATLDRTHTPANVAAGVEAARSLGLECSVDLIYGTPGESLDDWRRSVETALDLGVDHISAYGLALEPTTKMGRRVAEGRLPSPDDDDEAAKYELADDLFRQAGLHWYEISNWARLGHESRHNLGYWRNVDWAGIGPGAHSHYAVTALGAIGDPGGCVRSGQAGEEDGYGVTKNVNRAQQPESEEGNGWRRTGNSTGGPELSIASLEHSVSDNAWMRTPVRSWDISHPRQWAHALNEGRVPWAGGECIGPDERVEELVMLGLRLHEGLSISGLERSIGAAIGYGSMDGIIRDGLACLEGDRLIPTRRGRLLNDDLIARVLDVTDQARKSKAGK